MDSAQHINLESVQDTYSNRSDNKNSGSSIGAFVGASGNSYGIGLEASANKGKGHENSDSVTQRNTVLNTDNLTLNSQADTNIKGAVVNAKRLEGEIGGDLNIESRQDTNHYASKQTQVSAGASVAIYGSGSSASVNASHSSAKVNYAQVNEQSGLRVGEDGMNLTVGGNTHLKGGLIDSQASADKNHFSTGTLTTENIDNYSDVSVQSISGGLSSDMGNLAMTSMAAAMSALGNVSKDDSATTQSAVSQNINLDVRNGEIPTALSRDTATANQQVEQFDKAEYQERAEMAQVISQISNNSIVLSLKPKLDEAAQQKAEAEVVLASENSTAEQKEAAQIQLANADKAIEKYGKGGTIQMAVRAVTGVLQGIATGSAESAVVGGISPYANLAIKQATEGNDTANIMAHAMLGAIEAYATGNNTAAGAVGAASGELAAKIITEQLYGKEAKDLTEEQKETVSALSQIAAGLSGALVGDNTQSAVVSAEIGKRAVENNYLFAQEAQEKAILENKVRQGTATEEDKARLEAIKKEDKRRDNEIITACANGVSSQSCQNLINQAEYAQFGYEQAISYNLKVKELYPNDYQAVTSILKGNEDVEFERMAINLSNSGNISLDEAKSYLNTVKTYQAFAELVGQVYAPAALKRMSVGDLPKGIGANESLPVVGKTEGYENQTTTYSTGIIHLGFNVTNTADFSKHRTESDRGYNK